MMIVDRNTFLKLPEGTVYAKFESDSFGEVCIKKENCGTNDWYYKDIFEFDDYDESSERYDKIKDMVENEAAYYLRHDSVSRDGFFDEDQLFAIYGISDVKSIINELKKAIGEA